MWNDPIENTPHDFLIFYNMYSICWDFMTSLKNADSMTLLNVKMNARIMKRTKLNFDKY